MRDKRVASRHHVVIIGGGFGGLYATKALKHTPVQVTLVDKRNFHLFQPLLYQVATGGLSPGDIASPLRAILRRHKNTTVVKAEVIDINPIQQKVILSDGDLYYDTLIVATGASHHHFGQDKWAEIAPGLKSVEDALDIRRRILSAFEAAEREADPEKRRTWMRFIVVGGGPTGVELAGAIGELAHATMKSDFRNIDPVETEIVLIESMDRILPGYARELSRAAETSLSALGVTVRTKCVVDGIHSSTVTVVNQGQAEQVQAHTILWAAGMKASPLGRVLAERTGVELDRAGRVMVQPDLSLAGFPNILVIGDLAHFTVGRDGSLPSVAPVAMQQGRYAANLIQSRLTEKELPPFSYRDKGNLAVIGRNAAVAELGSLKFSGFAAWLIWALVHISYLIEFDNKLLVLIQWAWNYFTRNRGARLITGSDRLPKVKSRASHQVQAATPHVLWRTSAHEHEERV